MQKSMLDRVLETNVSYYKTLPTPALVIMYEDYDQKIIKCCSLGLVNACSSLMLAMKSINEELINRNIIH